MKLPGIRHFLPLVIILLSSCSNSLTTQSADSAGNNRETGEAKPLVVSSGEKAFYPSEFPFAQYPASKVTMYIDNGNKQGQLCKSVTLETSDSATQAESYYRNWFKENGWKVNLENNTPGMSTISAQHDVGIASIMCMRGVIKDKTNIQITISSGN